MLCRMLISCPLFLAEILALLMVWFGRPWIPVSPGDWKEQVFSFTFDRATNNISKKDIHVVWLRTAPWLASYSALTGFRNSSPVADGTSNFCWCPQLRFFFAVDRNELVCYVWWYSKSHSSYLMAFMDLESYATFMSYDDMNMPGPYSLTISRAAWKCSSPSQW